MTKTRLGTLTISSGATDSSELGFQDLRHIRSLTIFSPATLPETVHIEVTYEDDRAGTVSTWVDLQSDGADINVTAGDTVTITDVSFLGLRLVSGTNVAADRDFVVVGAE